MESESTFRESVGKEAIIGGDEKDPYYGYMQLSVDNCEAAAAYGIDAHTEKGNIEWGTRLLGKYIDIYGSDYGTVVACYKYGQYFVEDALKDGRSFNKYPEVIDRMRYWEIIIAEELNK